MRRHLRCRKAAVGREDRIRAGDLQAATRCPVPSQFRPLPPTHHKAPRWWYRPCRSSCHRCCSRRWRCLQPTSHRCSRCHPTPLCRPLSSRPANSWCHPWPSRHRCSNRPVRSRSRRYYYCCPRWLSRRRCSRPPLGLLTNWRSRRMRMRHRSKCSRRLARKGCRPERCCCSHLAPKCCHLGRKRRRARTKCRRSLLRKTRCYNQSSTKSEPWRAAKQQPRREKRES